MAKDLIRLSGFEPDVDIKIEYIGLRPGEKLSEELITEDEGIVQTSHQKIMVVQGPVCDIELINGKMDHLLELATKQDEVKIKRILKALIPEYTPETKDAKEIH